MKEEEIRPDKVFKEYLRLADLDSKKFFENKNREKISCPACLSEGNHIFIKHGFDYNECQHCQSIYVSPRPKQQEFFNYYQNSDSAKYFATTFYDITSESRREKLWKPKAKLINNIIKKYHAECNEIVDIGGGYGIFAEEYSRLCNTKITIIEPGIELSDICAKKGFTVINSFLEDVAVSDLSSNPKVFVSFELFEHLHDCNLFVKKLSNLMKPGDLFIFSTLSSIGVDIQCLWENSNSISLQHLNFFNPNSIKILLNRNGFDTLDVSTPGKLDIDILNKNRDLIKDRFFRTVLFQSNEEIRDKIQNFISGNGYSSHMLVVSQKSNILK